MKRIKKKQYRSIPRGSYRHALAGGRPYYFFAAALSLWLPKSYAAVLVDLDATTLPIGALTNWANTGSLGGQFTAPAGGVPSVATNQFVKGVTFNGTTQYYTGPDASVVAGAAPRTVEAWVLNPALADEETIFSWGRRGGPAGSNASFNHGANPVFGAVGHWDLPDVGWNGNIASNRWTYVVYTFDGLTTRVYFDGTLANSEDTIIDTWAVDNTPEGNPLPFRVASQNEANGTPTGNFRGSMTIAKIRVHNEAISDATIQANFAAQAISFGLGDQDNDGLPTFFENQYPAFLSPTDPADAARDQDNDGLTNLQEYTRRTAPDRADTDGDTIPDGVEVNRTAGGNAAPTDPLRADTDGDGLNDNVETDSDVYVSRTNTGTDPLVRDSDGDTFDDLQEAISGSEPNVATSTPSATRGPIVSLDAGNLPTGVVNTWTNAGTLGGNFVGSGAPRAGVVQGVNAITFNSTGTGQFYTGPAAPPFVAGNNSRSVEAWILNPAAADEETIFSWGRRGGPDGSNASFNHGLNGTFGAVGQWGAPDVGWGGVENVKQGQWTHVAYTYEGGDIRTLRVFAEGVEVNSETFVNPLGIHATNNAGLPLPFRIASQNNASGTATGDFRGSMSIAEIRVYDRTIDPAIFAANFAAGQDKYGLVDYDNDELPTWYERQYGFPERTANATEDPDSDGLNNLLEFQNGTNPTVADTDGDGLNDGAEVNRAPATNPLLADSDQDGLSDKVETGDGSFNGPTDTGTDPLVVDTDGDTFSDGQEVFNGSNPTTLNSTPTFAASRPLIDLNPSSLANGAVQSWTNSGSMGGAFTAPTDLGATAETVSGAKAVTFRGTNYYNGPVTPEFITGNASRTVDAWLFNPAVAAEESIIAWGRRGGPEGSNASYIHGTDATFGAMGQWGAGPDVGWSTNTPLAGQWTHVAYVYDGPSLTATVYRDGVVANTETFGVALAIHATNSVGAPLLFKLGAQNNADGSPGGQFASLSMGRVRVYDHALSGSDVASIYNAEKAGYPILPDSVDITAVALNPTSRAITITWTPPTGRTVAVDASTNLTTWDPVATGLTAGQFSEPTTGANYKFYRLRVE